MCELTSTRSYEKPARVRLDLRLPRSLHKRLKREAETQVVSMSILVTRALEQWFATQGKSE